MRIPPGGTHEMTAAEESPAATKPATKVAALVQAAKCFERRFFKREGPLSAASGWNRSLCELRVHDQVGFGKGRFRSFRGVGVPLLHELLELRTQFIGTRGIQFHLEFEVINTLARFRRKFWLGYLGRSSGCGLGRGYYTLHRGRTNWTFRGGRLRPFFRCHALLRRCSSGERLSGNRGRLRRLCCSHLRLLLFSRWGISGFRELRLCSTKEAQCHQGHGRPLPPRHLSRRRRDRVADVHCSWFWFSVRCGLQWRAGHHRWYALRLNNSASKRERANAAAELPVAAVANCIPVSGALWINPIYWYWERVQSIGWLSTIKGE